MLLFKADACRDGLQLEGRPLKSKSLIWGGLVAACLALTGCAAGTRSPSTFSVPRNLDPSGPPQLGEGGFLYQFELRNWLYALEPNQPFALSIQNAKGHVLPFVQDRKKVYQGVTDAVGRTPVIALPFKVKAKNWRLRERFGAGPYGEDFRLIDPARKKPSPGVDYIIFTCGKAPRHYEGTSNAQGFAAYVATEEPEQLFLYYRDRVDDPNTAIREACEHGSTP